MKFKIGDKVKIIAKDDISVLIDGEGGTYMILFGEICKVINIEDYRYCVEPYSKKVTLALVYENEIIKINNLNWNEESLWLIKTSTKWK